MLSRSCARSAASVRQVSRSRRRRLATDWASDSSLRRLCLEVGGRRDVFGVGEEWCSDSRTEGSMGAETWRAIDLNSRDLGYAGDRGGGLGGLEAIVFGVLNCIWMVEPGELDGCCR